METIEKYVCEIVPTYRKLRRIKSEPLTSNEKVVCFIRKQFPRNSINHYETFGVVFFDRQMNVLGVRTSEGGITGSLVDIRLVFQKALLCNATQFIIFHNHPSGSLKASQADYDISRKLTRAGEVMDIKMLDSIIITEKDYTSIKY